MFVIWLAEDGKYDCVRDFGISNGQTTFFGLLKAVQMYKEWKVLVLSKLCIVFCIRLLTSVSNWSHFIPLDKI